MIAVQLNRGRVQPRNRRIIAASRSPAGSEAPRRFGSSAPGPRDVPARRAWERAGRARLPSSSVRFPVRCDRRTGRGPEPRLPPDRATSRRAARGKGQDARGYPRRPSASQSAATGGPVAVRSRAYPRTARRPGAPRGEKGRTREVTLVVRPLPSPLRPEDRSRSGAAPTPGPRDVPARRAWERAGRARLPSSSVRFPVRCDRRTGRGPEPRLPPDRATSRRAAVACGTDVRRPGPTVLVAPPGSPVPIQSAVDASLCRRSPKCGRPS